MVGRVSAANSTSDKNSYNFSEGIELLRALMTMNNSDILFRMCYHLLYFKGYHGSE